MVTTKANKELTHTKHAGRNRRLTRQGKGSKFEKPAPLETANFRKIHMPKKGNPLLLKVSSVVLIFVLEQIWKIARTNFGDVINYASDKQHFVLSSRKEQIYENFRVLFGIWRVHEHTQTLAAQKAAMYFVSFKVQLFGCN